MPNGYATPKLHGIEYHQGPLYQTTLRTFVIHRDNSTCRYCGKKAKPVELDHVDPTEPQWP